MCGERVESVWRESGEWRVCCVEEYGGVCGVVREWRVAVKVGNLW